MNNLYDFLMARELGNIKDAPNKQRIGQAPLNLRSAMKYANGGGIGYPPSQIAGLTPLESRPEPQPLPEKRYPDMVAPPRPGNPNKDVPYPENLRPQEPKGPVSGITTDGGTYIPGYQGVGTPEFFAQYANNPTIMALLQQMYGLNSSDASIPNPEKSLSPYLPTYKPPPIPEKSLSPYLPTYTPPKISEESLSPNIPSYTPASSDARYAFSNDLLSLLNDKNSPKLSGGVGSGMPGPGTDQSLDYLIHYLATKRK